MALTLPIECFQVSPICTASLTSHFDMLPCWYSVYATKLFYCRLSNWRIRKSSKSSGISMTENRVYYGVFCIPTPCPTWYSLLVQKKRYLTPLHIKSDQMWCSINIHLMQTVSQSRLRLNCQDLKINATGSNKGHLVPYCRCNYLQWDFYHESVNYTP